MVESTPSYTLFYCYDANGHLAAINERYPTSSLDNWYYTVCNSRGDVIAIYDEDKYFFGKYTYDSWGKIVSITDEWGNDISTYDDIVTRNSIRYRGYVYDTETGLYYLNSRYYDPETCRFISADGQLNQSEGISGYNLYVYCGNNPINYSDPTGHAFFVVTGLIGAAAGAVVGGIVAHKNGKNVWAGIGIGAAAGGLIGMGAGAAAGVLLTGSATAGTVAVASGAKMLATAVGAGGIGAGVDYIANNISNATSNTILNIPYSDSSIIKNDVINLPRTGSALKTDAFHAFPDIIDNYAGYAFSSPISNGTLYQLPGALNGIEGRFEWIIQDQQITHRMFVAGGGINGIPIMP